ncbi:KGGVGR-motif variant AAA ATPase [Gloeothece verrucosa]|uniref:ATPase involved in chromosome partitioning-like protein n=1 Tax=Gloeothece verrucosa (strain PCC 7822) TaxID=497965 RepID=E0UCF7_GLOV7|nr:AAA family ATPase [Gloeothece verrucosa]ADN14028.1 ATPase involved in chromosome partitioning-like protein [Gloeothece verrucosa PCC 7822]
MKTITFYSYKGGVGRSLTAANFSVYLAKLGLKTVLIDFDLEAPGIDAKFNLPEPPHFQKGVLDYILHYQQYNEELGNIKDLCISVPLEASETGKPASLWIIPAGQYLTEEYYKKLSQLDWGIIFSQREGVAFFQQFLAHIKEELQADFVIIDSRTGITESSGLCTQQLADEVIMLSSLSSESIRVTKHIKNLIEQSQIAKALGKSIEVKLVVSRVPKPDDLMGFKQDCCELFDIEDNKLFFLFSCPALEQKEFLAITESDSHEELVSNYVKLFYAIQIELAETNILKQIEIFTQKILFLPEEEAEKQILELAAIYPHPEIYRTAMRFFKLTKNSTQMKIFCWKLLELLPDDEEVQIILGKEYLRQLKIKIEHQAERFIKNAIRAIEPLYQKNKLNVEEKIIYGETLVINKEYQKSLEILLPLCNDEEIPMNFQFNACNIAADAAIILNDYPLAIQLQERVKAIEKELDDIPF